MTSRLKSKALLIGAVVALGTGSAALAAAPQAMAPQRVAQADAAGAKAATGGDTAQSRNAARSRMRECGHQWSSMKKNGSAAGMTWKDFSQGCLAKQ